MPTTKTATRTTHQLREAALAGETIDPAELAAAQAAEELAELQAEGARRRAAEKAEADRQAGLERLASDVAGFSTDTEEVVAATEAVFDKLGELYDLLRAHDRRVRSLALRARDLGAPEVNDSQAARLAPGEVARASSPLGGVAVYAGEEGGGHRVISSGNPARSIFAALGEAMARLELPSRDLGDIVAVQRGAKVAPTIRAMDKIVPPRDEVELIGRRGQRVTVSRASAPKLVERLGFRWPDEPLQLDDQADEHDGAA